MPAGSFGHCPPPAGIDTIETAHDADVPLYAAETVALPSATPVISNSPDDCPTGTTIDAGTDAIPAFVVDRVTVALETAGPDRLTATELVVPG